MRLAETPAEFKAARIELGLTQKQLADMLDVSEVSISNWENGRNPIPRTAEMALWAIATWRAFAHVIQPAP